MRSLLEKARQIEALDKDPAAIKQALRSMEMLHARAKAASSALGKMARDPRKYAPQVDNLKQDLRSMEQLVGRIRRQLTLSESVLREGPNPKEQKHFQKLEQGAKALLDGAKKGDLGRVLFAFELLAQPLGQLLLLRGFRKELDAVNNAAGVLRKLQGTLT